MQREVCCRFLVEIVRQIATRVDRRSHCRQRNDDREECRQTIHRNCLNSKRHRRSLPQSERCALDKHSNSRHADRYGHRPHNTDCRPDLGTQRSGKDQHSGQDQQNQIDNGHIVIVNFVVFVTSDLRLQPSPLPPPQPFRCADARRQARSNGNRVPRQRRSPRARNHPRVRSV